MNRHEIESLIMILSDNPCFLTPSKELLDCKKNFFDIYGKPYKTYFNIQDKMLVYIGFVNNKPATCELIKRCLPIKFRNIRIKKRLKSKNIFKIQEMEREINQDFLFWFEFPRDPKKTEVKVLVRIVS